MRKVIVEETFNNQGKLIKRTTTTIEGEKMVQPVDNDTRPLDPTDVEERRDDEAWEESFDRMQLLNLKEGYDIFRGDDRFGFRARGRETDLIFAETMSERIQARRHAQEDHDMRMRQAEILFGERGAALEDTKVARKLGDVQSVRHADLAGLTGMRDQVRDNTPSS